MLRNNFFSIPIIGLEIHVELKTNSKMFCGCSADYFGHQPNTHCCPVCLGLPGSLPVPNKKAIEWTVIVGLALNSEVPLFSKFDRKNYFYPDLPKGYQISQYDQPLCVQGWLKIAGRKIRIRRVHLEEDTGKLLHTEVNGEKCTLIDFNRSGVPLMEVVTEPDLRSGKEAKLFLQELQQILRYTGGSECDMEKGSMRLEPNVSVMKISNSKHQISNKFQIPNSKLPNYKVEIKNLNSFRFVKKAIDYEIQRQIEILKRGERVSQETRGWDEKKEITFSQRGKEEASDYRYFPEPDIPPIRWKKEEIEKLRNLLPELPDARLLRFIKEYGLSEYETRILTSKKETADYYEEAIKAYKKLKIKKDVIKNRYSRKERDKKHTLKIKNYERTISQWIINKRIDIDETLPVALIERILKKYAPSTIGERELEKIVVQVLLDNQKAVRDYKRGKTQALMFLVGQVMKALKGRADAKLIAKFLNEKIKM